MKNSVLLISSIFVFCGSWAFGQNDIDVIPPSPVSREFSKYLTHEVALYNGIPEISIPLHTINVGGLTIPISLSYHASGIKYAQADGEVGVGWVLNPGYRISRNIYGFADELVAMPSDFSTVLSNYEQNADGGNSEAKAERDRYLAKFVPGTIFNYGRFDGEYDQFTFSIPTAGGGFIITDRVNKTVATTEESNLWIEYETGQSVCQNLEGIKGFQITDDRGNRYAFGEYYPQILCNLETASAYYGGHVATAWGLSKITTPKGDQVDFTYTRGTAGEFVSHMRSFTISETGRLAQGCDVETTYDETYSTGHGYYTFYRDEIKSPNETIIFHYSLDPEFPKKIWRVEIKTSSGDLVKMVEFSYSKGTHHTFLDKVTTYDSDHANVETYHFEYYAKTSSMTFTVDHYGNYLPTTYPNQYYHQEFLDDPVLGTEPGQYGYDCKNWTVNSLMGGLATSREPSGEFQIPNYFSLKKITYPTGGFTEYEYEHGKYRAVGDTGPIRNSGIRIASIKSFDAATQEGIVKRYTYGNNENGYGFAHAWVLDMARLFVRETAVMNTQWPYTQRRAITYSTTIQGDVGAVFGQSGFVKYPCVTEYHSDSPNDGIGKTMYCFDVGRMFDIGTLNRRNVVPLEVYGSSPYHVHRYRLWDKPLLSQKVIYLLSDGQYTPVREEIFDYDKTSETYVGLKVEQAATNGSDIIHSTSYGSANQLDRYFNYGEYYVTIGKSLLKRRVKIYYFDDKEVSVEHNYDYSNLLVSRETVTKSTGEELTTYTTFPNDYAAGTPFIDDMRSNNLISYPIEQVTYLDNGTTQRVIIGNVNQYKPGGSGLLDMQWVLETSSPVTLNHFKFSNRSLGILPPLGVETSFLPDNRYTQKTIFDRYDNKGNIIQYHEKDDVPVSYLWSYNQKYPIAKIENADYTTVEMVLGGTSAVQVFSEKTYPTDGEISAFLAPLFIDARLDKARVSTFTYKPLIGMTSQTDVNGQTIYYAYDSYGRLIRIKDHDFNILKHFKYHYREN